MTENTFQIGLVQHACIQDQAANIEQAINGIREAAGRGAQIICLQELFKAPYFCKAEAADRYNLAEPIPGPTLNTLQEIVRKLEIVLIVPLFERRASGVYHNSAAVLDADGSLLGVYRKMHIPDDPLYYEKYYFTPGDAVGPAGGFRIFRTRYATIGVLICWDQWYPEAARITALCGAEVLFYPTAIGWHPAEKASFGPQQVDAWRTVQRGHAVANGLYVASVNRIGIESEPGTDGLEFFGQSFICDPFGQILAEAPAEQPAVLTASCDRAYMEDVRRNWPFLRDRRIDAYSSITARSLEKREYE
ncbi:MAG: carbon-nitrogen hydrolase [Phycisphaerales bacterium]|nr:carbon-nitrogen hydrolase [Phycisphaerales bacterium]